MTGVLAHPPSVNTSISHFLVHRPVRQTPAVHREKVVVKMTNAQSPQAYMDKTAVDAQGDKIGSVGQVYVNDQTGQPDWITVNTGLFGTKEHFAPLHGSNLEGDNLVLPFDKDVVKNSPDVSDSAHLDPAEQQALYSYYQQYVGNQGGHQNNSDTAYDADRANAEGGYAGGDANSEGSLTRSEEQLHVGTEKVAAGRAGIRKFVVTEQQTVNVPVSHDEVHVVREPLQPGDNVDGATIGDDSVEVTLMEDQVHVDKQVVGVEKISLETETVTEDQEVTEAVRKEQVEVTGDDTTTLGEQDRPRR